MQGSACAGSPLALSSQAIEERSISRPSNARPDAAEIKRLLARASLIRNGCDLDLLVFLYRHPRILLTSEQIAAFVGREMKQVAQSLDMFIAAGLLERTQNPTHAARMYLLELDGPQGDGFKKLLELASTREGRRVILEHLKPAGTRTAERSQRLRLVKSACR